MFVHITLSAHTENGCFPAISNRRIFSTADRFSHAIKKNQILGPLHFRKVITIAKKYVGTFEK